MKILVAVGNDFPDVIRATCNLHNFKQQEGEALRVTLGHLWVTMGALDELLMFHERIDKGIHSILSLKQNAWTDRFDDLIVGLYVGLGAWFILVVAKVESFLGRPKRLFVGGLAVAVVMVGLDLLTNGRAFVTWLFGPELGIFLRIWLSILEDCLKLVAVAMFLIGLVQNADLLSSSSRLASLGDEN